MTRARGERGRWQPDPWPQPLDPAEGAPPPAGDGNWLALDLTSPYEPRPQFLGFHRRTQRWAAIVAHRRAGKTVACVNELIAGAAKCERDKPRFAYIAPHLNQAKDIAWTYLKDYTSFIPRRTSLESELWVQLPGGARIRIYGADNADRIRGVYFDGVVFDEFGDMDPAVWSSVVRPMLSDPGRQGWACFIGTPKGHNGFHRLWTEAEADPDWFRLELKASQTRLIDQKELADARKAMSDDEYAQEFECSFEAAVRGAYFAKELNALAAASPPQITSVPHDPNLPVHTAWDLGISDSTVIWFLQVHGRETRVIDVLKGEGVSIAWYAKALEERPALHGRVGNWVWGNHYLPHDAEARDLTSGKNSVETLAALGVRATIVPRLDVQDGIQAVRGLLPMCWFDAARCKEGIQALKAYRRDYDARAQELQTRPRHDWTSHYADAFRYFAVGHREMPPASRGPIRRNTGWVA